MSVYGQPPGTPSLLGAPRAAAFVQVIVQAMVQVAETVRKVCRAIEHRREVSGMMRLDDRMLHDIGLTRSDLNDATAEPIWSDPSRVLIARTVERRGAARLRARAARAAEQ